MHFGMVDLENTMLFSKLFRIRISKKTINFDVHGYIDDDVMI